MQDVPLQYGDGEMTASLPDSATVVRYGQTYVDPPAVDPVEATRRALDEPLGMPPIEELVGPGDRVAIGFPDRVKGGTHDLAHRKVAIPMILDRLRTAGVRDEDITMICAIGLHRKNTEEEMRSYLPDVVFERLRPEQITNHDAADADNLVDLGTSAHGDVVTFNRTAAEADLCIVIGHSQGNPYGGFSGGYKTSTTGMTTWRSIAGHHTPGTMGRDDFVPINPHSHFRSQLNAIGHAIEEGIGKRMFVVDAVTGGEAQVLGVFAGAADEVQAASWPLATQRTEVHLATEPADILVFGLPRSFHYGPGMGTNPVLMRQATSACIARAAGAFREGGIVIVASACDGWFNEEWFPSYPATFELFQDSYTVSDLTKHEEDFAERDEWVQAYRDGRSYHPFHAFSMLYFSEVGISRASKVIVAGAESPQYARALEMTPTRDFDGAFRLATRLVGSNPKVLALPDFLRTSPPHLFADRD